MQSPVLIPRPETEQLVGLVIDDLKERIVRAPRSPEINVLEIGCGSGAVSLSLINEVPSSESGRGGEAIETRKTWQMYAIDVSEKAVELTLRNAKELNLDAVLSLRHASLCELVEGNFGTITLVLAVHDVKLLFVSFTMPRFKSFLSLRKWCKSK